MKEQDIVFKLISILQNSLPSNFDVRTDGGDADASPPICILKWNTQGNSVGGSNPFAGIIRDQEENAIGRELHRHSTFVAEILLRSYSEADRDNLGANIHDDLLPYMYDSDLFNEDTYQWRVGEFTPKDQSVVERDWYEGVLVARFGYVKRVEQMAETLQNIQENISG